MRVRRVFWLKLVFRDVFGVLNYRQHHLSALLLRKMHSDWLIDQFELRRYTAAMRSKMSNEHTYPTAESPLSVGDYEFEILLETLAEGVAAVSALVDTPCESTIAPSVSLDEDTASVITIPCDSRCRFAEVP